MRDPLREVTVVCEKDHAFRVPIETTDRENPDWPSLEIIGNRRTTFWVVHRRDDVLRFVEAEIDFFTGRFHGLAVHGDAVAWQNTRAEFVNFFAVNENRTLTDQLIGVTPACDASFTQVFI